MEKAIERAEILRVFDLAAVQDVLARANGRSGAARLRAAIAAIATKPPTRNELEQAMFDICTAARMPRPEVNWWIPLTSGPGYEPDFCWPDLRLIAETDGFETHGTRTAFEQDRRRDQQLAVQGWRVVRFTWRQVIYEPKTVRRQAHPEEDAPGAGRRLRRPGGLDVGRREHVVRRLGARLRHQHVAPARGKEVGNVEADTSSEHARYPLLEQQVLDQLGLRLMPRPRHAHQVAARVLGPDLARALVRLARRGLLPHVVADHERHAAVAAEAVLGPVLSPAGGTDKRLT